MGETTGAPEAANLHLVDHMAAAEHRFEASEDIFAGNGMKLLAKGTPIGNSVREQLLNHKLRKPLEQSMRVVDGLIPARFGPMAEELLAEHRQLEALCHTERGPGVAQALTSLQLSEAVQCLLTLHGELVGERMKHSVGVAMLALAFARKLAPRDTSLRQSLSLAGLVHDIGELYIDPQCLRREGPLPPEQWRQIAAHPTIGHRVLRNLEGAGKEVAEAVLLHHERLNGFGYPRRIAGAQFPLHGQILAAAEWLMGIIDSGLAPGSRMQIATRLLPGEFGAPLLDLINASAARSEELAAVLSALTPLGDLAPRVARIAATIGRFVQSRAWIDAQIATSRGELRSILVAGLDRMLRIQAAFSSTGLDSGAPDVLLRELAALSDDRMQLEVVTVVRELEWRLRDLERESLMRAALLSGPESAYITELLVRMKEGAPQ